MTIKKSKTINRLDKIIGHEESFGSMLRAFRLSEGMSQPEFAKLLGLSKQHLCDVERGRRSVDAKKAAKYAKTLGVSELGFVTLAIQDEINKSGLKFRIEVKAA